MCSEGGTDTAANSDVSELTAESSVENNDASTELCETSEASESSEELVGNSEEQMNEEMTENGDKTDEGDDSVAESTEENGIPSEEETEVDEEAVREEINKKSEYSDEVNEKISSVEELEVYQKANLKEERVDGRTCLVRDNIDLEYVDPKSGMTNQELMEKGRAPYDAETGERIELHHVGQDYDSPLAELTEDTEHGDYYSALHTKEGESWRNDSQKSNHYNNVERPGHWRSRVNGG